MRSLEIKVGRDFETLAIEAYKQLPPALLGLAITVVDGDGFLSPILGGTDENEGALATVGIETDVEVLATTLTVGSLCS